MKTIKDHCAEFITGATADGFPYSKSQCLELAFYAGWMAQMKAGGDTSHLSDMEAERTYSAMREELRAMFDRENIATFYRKPIPCPK